MARSLQEQKKEIEKLVMVQWNIVSFEIVNENFYSLNRNYKKESTKLQFAFCFLMFNLLFIL